MARIATFELRRCGKYCEALGFSKAVSQRSVVGTGLAFGLPMGIQRIEDLVALQLAVELKLAVYRLIKEHPSAEADFRFRGQLSDAVASVEMNIAEGWRRHSAKEFCQFLRYSRASLEETERWISDGVARGHYSEIDAAPLLTLADRCGRTTMGLWSSLQPFIKNSRKR